MNHRNTYLLLGLLIVLVAAYFLFIHQRGSTSLARDESDFAIEDTAAIQRITMRGVEDGIEMTAVVLERDPEGGWIVNGRHRAVDARVQTLLQTLHLMRVRGTLSEAGKKKGRELTEKRHVRVQVFTEEGLLKSFLVGPQTKDATGTTMLMEGAETPYIVGLPGFEGFLNPRFTLEYDRWRENLLFNARPGDLQEITLRYKEPGRSWQLQRDGDSWSLKGLEVPLDTTALSTYLDNFTGKIYGESFAEAYYPHKIDTLKTQEPDIRFELTFNEGSKRELLLYVRPDNANNYFGWIEGEDELITVQQFVFGSFLVEKTYFVEN